MADKQLTVAELMARAQQENPDAQPRRRRRRSLDEGGVSVAELTGSLKAVDARPAEVKHSSVPIDAEPTEPAEPAEPSKPVRPAEPTQQEKSGQKPAAPAAQKETAAPVQKVTKIERTPQPEKPAPKPAAKETPEPAAKETPKPAVKTAPKPEPVKEQPAPARPEPRPQDETLTRSSFKAVAPQPSKTEQTGPISRVVSLGDRPAADLKEPSGKLIDERPDVDKPAFREPDADVETTQESPVVRDEHLPEQPVYRTEEVDQVEVDNSVNPIMLVLLVFAGLVVGVLMFLGFQYLWASLNPILAGVLALAVTGGVVMLVRAMKTGRDALTMTLAALAGAAMTFGPALVTTV